MSDERPKMTPPELDELASAYLDGEATEEEAALVASEPRLQELVAELSAVRDLVAAPVELPSDEVRDQMIARALDQRASVVSLKKARLRLRSTPPRARVVLAAAAVVAAIALVGVTVFEQIGDDGAGEQFADDSAPGMADAPADDEEMPLPAPVAEAESAEAAEDSPTGPDSDDAAVAFSAEAPAEAMMDEEMAIDLAEAPMDDGPASDEAPEEEGEPEPMMVEEPVVVSTSGEALLVFDTAADLAAYAMELAGELSDPPEIERIEEAAAIDLMGCPSFPDEGLELLARFDAVVDEVEVQVSVYLSGRDLQLTETSPPPGCELLNSHTIGDWSQ